MWQIKLEAYFSECRKVAHRITTLQLLSKDLRDCCLNLLLLPPTHRSTASETDQKMPLAFLGPWQSRASEVGQQQSSARSRGLERWSSGRGQHCHSGVPWCCQYILLGWQPNKCLFAQSRVLRALLSGQHGVGMICSAHPTLDEVPVWICYFQHPWDEQTIKYFEISVHRDTRCALQTMQCMLVIPVSKEMPPHKVYTGFDAVADCRATVWRLES